MATLTYQSCLPISSLQALERFAVQLAAFLKPGDLVALNGPLGAGKTTLTQALGRAMGIQEPISSPTFVLMNEYHSGDYPLIHLDLYRLGPQNTASLAEELYALVDEGRSVVLVEWAEYGPFLDALITLSLSIQHVADPALPESRFIEISSNRPLFEMTDDAGGLS
ncbi:tRNA (adenosine(37)-N6)-threonylcarbamoyltransferase complex ATPase subunit type 1 TsaE [Vampirovibrio sp.]|uniref:tRNA (adenosine(37)-N6)-threonylcarbamoyltransferase complex ATPase subunit type 1 TsaE n=1 Tax=Vampirovibrio sp. TaxID=2717857 RepID=UPI003593585A